MRSISDLIRELGQEAAQLTHVALAVAFDHETKFVLATAADPLSELNGLLESGGVPIGIIGVRTVEAGARFYSRPLHEHAHGEWVADYLGRLRPSFTALLQSAGDTPRRIGPEPNGKGRPRVT